jgi:membrane protease YdiL (CAAX protease family)
MAHPESKPESGPESELPRNASTPPPLPSPGDERSTGRPPAIPTPPAGPAADGRSAGLRILVSWILILSLAVGWVFLSNIRHPDEAVSGPSRVSMISEIGGRLMHNLIEWLGTTEDRENVVAMTIDGSDPGDAAPWIDQVAFAILQADLDKPSRGLAKLQEIGLPDGASDADATLFATVRDALEQWERGEARPALPEAEAARLGWFGHVLDGTVPPSNLAVLLVMAFAWYAAFVVVGVVLLVTLVVLIFLGKVKPQVAVTGHSAIYAETFALWFLCFLSFQLAVGVIVQLTGLEGWIMVGALVAMFGSLAALAWPVLRGMSWRDVRRDIGLHTGRGVLIECAFGPLTYAVALPLMFVGLVLFSILKKLSEDAAQPSHPVFEELGGGIQAVIPVYLLACVAAPIVEEIAFRGILYRHLRESGRVIGTALSVLVAMLVSSVLFAGIHPQGLLFIPVLGGLATGFCIAREFRGSLLPGMVAHAITNFVTVSLGVALAHG